MSIRDRIPATRAAGFFNGSLAPLIDVLFLLLIFLLVSANFDRREVLEVNLPSADTGATMRSPEDHDRRVTLHADGTLELSGAPVTRAQLEEALKSRPLEDRLLPFRIQGDERAALGAGIGLLDLLRELGYRDCSFEVRRP